MCVELCSFVALVPSYEVSIDKNPRLGLGVKTEKTLEQTALVVVCLFVLVFSRLLYLHTFLEMPSLIYFSKKKHFDLDSVVLCRLFLLLSLPQFSLGHI